MKALIIEDEQLSREALARTVTTEFPDIEIVGMTASIKDSVEYIKRHEDAIDVIFMDVELSDGTCFEIFRQVDVRAKVIMITAYDNYAVKAFEAGSIDYLLKPIDTDALHRAVSRIRESSTDIDKMAKILASLSLKKKEYNERFIVRFNDRIIPVRTADIAYFYSEGKNNYIMTSSGTGYIIESSLNDIQYELDPDEFFKISRNCIVALSAIQSITKQIGGRLKISAIPESAFEMTVSRSKADEFLQWLER